MTPKEKAIELVDIFANAQSEDGFVNTNKYRHKQCVLFAVNEIIKDIPDIETYNSRIDYWKEVKNELNKL